MRMSYLLEKKIYTYPTHAIDLLIEFVSLHLIGHDCLFSRDDPHNHLRTSLEKKLPM
jgi:hypothetical protein